MARIFVIQDLSPAQSWLFSQLIANQDRLAQAGIVMAPFNPWSCQLVPNHFYCGLEQSEIENPSQPYLNYWQSIKSTLAGAKNSLLLLNSADPVFYENLAINLHKRVAGHEVLFLSIIGHPALALEMSFREASLTAEQIAHLCKTYQQMPVLLAGMCRQFGRSNITFVPNCQTSPTSRANATLTAKVFAFLGLPPPASSLRPPMYPIFLRSHDARILARSLQIRYNAWPELDENSCMSTLLALDEDWREDYSAPLQTRAAFTANCALAQLEQMLGLDPGQLTLAPDFVSIPAQDRPLDRDRAAAFVAKLCAQDRNALFLRLDQDYLFLNDNQKILHEVLAPGFAHIGPVRHPPAMTVLTMTYNHEKYIADCLEGVLSQKTDFSVLHLVLDHHSSDGTAAIVAKYARDYPSIQPILLSQRAPGENVLGLFLRCHSQYAALCDGDDFFTDPTKLQTQMNFMETHPDCAMCFHPVAAVFEDGRPPKIFPPVSALPRRSKKEFYLADLTNRNFIQTNSVVYRWRFQKGLPPWFRPDLCPGDWYWHLLHAETGKIGFIPKIMSVYRRHAGALYMDAFSASTADLRRKQGLAELAAYAAYDEHFKGRYFRSFASLADHVFMDFFGLSIDYGDDSLLNVAVDRFPRFAEHFLQGLEKMRNSGQELILKRRTKN